MHTTRARLGELLIADGALDREALERLLERQREEHRRLGELALDEGLTTEEGLRRVLSGQHGLDAVDLATRAPDRAALALVPTEVVRRVEAVPLAIEGQRLFVAMVDPEDLLAREEIRFASGFTELRLAVVTATDFARFVRRELNASPALEEALGHGNDAPVVIESGGTRSADTTVGVEAPPVVALVDHLLAAALQREASEVHVEPFDSAARIRLRADGHLFTLMTVPRRLHGAVVARLQLLAGGDGHAGQLLRVALPSTTPGTPNRQARFRVSGLEAAWGTSLTLRRVEVEARTLQDLGLPARTRSRLSKALIPPEGLVLVAGPREAGRSTTAGAIARLVNHPTRQVVLVSRDGVVTAPGAVAVPAGTTEALPALIEQVLGQNPDVVLIDGLDGDSARVAARAAVDGHLIIGTLRAARAFDAIERLVATGVPRWQLATALQAVIAQRLVRTVHDACAGAYEPTTAECDELSLPRELMDGARFRVARGCAKCFGSGYLGRTIISEALFFSRPLREAIRDGVPSDRLLELAREDGFTTQWEEGLVEAAKGRTTLDELRATLVGRDA